MSTVAAGNPIKQSLAALRAGQESLARFVVDLFSDLETVQRRLVAVQSQVAVQREQLADERRRIAEQQNEQSATHAELDLALRAKVGELENDRHALEEELESVRVRAVSMAQSLADQKKQMAEEHAEWAAELRQLRRILDKQAAWITQHAEMAGSAGSHLNAAEPTQNSSDIGVMGQNGNRHPTGFPATSGNGRQADAVVGSILSQFELLQRDVARRREQGDQAGKK